MKKLLLFVYILSYTLNISAQCNDTLPILEPFDDSNVVDVCWNLVDQDGDGYDWYWRDYGSFYGGHKCLTSRSRNSSDGDLNPDNWIYSYAIDLTSLNTNDDIELTWKVRGEMASLSHEYYTVYAATGNQISDFESSPVQRGEYADDVGAAGVFVTRSLDIASLAGNMVYIAFRHQNISGSQLIINIDDVTISTTLLGIDDFETSSFKHYYNIDSDVLTIKSSNAPLNNIEIFNILGQGVLNKKLSQINETVDLSSLKDGIYIARVKIDNTIKTIKFLKQ